MSAQRPESGLVSDRKGWFNSSAAVALCSGSTWRHLSRKSRNRGLTSVDFGSGRSRVWIRYMAYNWILIPFICTQNGALRLLLTVEAHNCCKRKLRGVLVQFSYTLVLLRREGRSIKTVTTWCVCTHDGGLTHEISSLNKGTKSYLLQAKSHRIGEIGYATEPY